MPVIIKMLRNEIDRLKVELSDLVGQRSKLVWPLEVRIAQINQRLGAAERMLTTYIGGDAEPDAPFRPGANLVETAPPCVNVETVALPSNLKGHRLHPTSKKAKIIRATKALLLARGIARRSEIVTFLHKEGIMAQEKNPEAYLSVVLSYAGEMFANNASGWYLRETRNPDRIPDSSSPDRSCDD
jgi:hypothetical protein